MWQSDHTMLDILVVGTDGTLWATDRSGTPVAGDVFLASESSVNVGAIDDLDSIATFTEEHGLWFHVDGAFGAPAVLSELFHRLAPGALCYLPITFVGRTWLEPAAVPARGPVTYAHYWGGGAPRAVAAAAAGFAVFDADRDAGAS